MATQEYETIANFNYVWQNRYSEVSIVVLTLSSVIHLTLVPLVVLVTVKVVETFIPPLVRLICLTVTATDPL